ncbi:MAG: hypothetical protein AAF432_11895 [Planctomycetota bacterium]
MRTCVLILAGLMMVSCADTLTLTELEDLANPVGVTEREDLPGMYYMGTAQGHHYFRHEPTFGIAHTVRVDERDYPLDRTIEYTGERDRWIPIDVMPGFDQ